MGLLTYLAIGMPGPGEWIIILAIVVLLFGAKRLPDLARSLGKSLSEFKKGKEEGQQASLDAESKEGKRDGEAKGG